MKSVVPIIIFLLGLGLTIEVNATAQQPDIIIYKGKKYSLQTNPLEEFFKKYPDKRPKTNIISTANWRGYVATFELVDSILFLLDIQIEIDTDKGLKKKSVISEVFPGKTTVELDWFNGILTLPYGELLNYVHMGYGSTFEYYFLLEVRQGKMTKIKDFKCEDYLKFKDKQFELFKQTDQYKQTLTVLKEKFKSTDDQLETFMKFHSADYVTYFIEN
jgi:hypothetical protein